MREVERSLTRLDTDHIDVYLVHTFDEPTPLEETIRALDDLVRSGKVRYVAVVTMQHGRSARACGSRTVYATPYMCVQNQYNLLTRHLEGEMFALVRDQGLGIWCIVRWQWDC